MKRKLKIEQIINHHLAVKFLDVKDVSKLHEGHAGYKEGHETHFEIKLVSANFEGVSKLERHRTLNKLLMEELNSGLHSVSYNLLSTSELE